MTACEALCALMVGGAGPYPSQGLGGPVRPGFGGPSGDEGQSGINDGVASALRRLTSARSAGSFRGRRTGSNAEVKAEFAVVLPEALRTQGKNGGQTRERSLFMSKKEKFALYLTPEKKSGAIRRTAAGASPALLSGRLISIWTISAPATPDCSCPPPSSPAWMAVWISWRTACPR